jgi:D-galactose 1-dehydrogenase
VPPIKIVIVGFGKIAQDQHVPSIAETQGLELVATVSRRGEAPAGIASFPTLEALAVSGVAVDAVAFCNPPEGRAKAAMTAADFGWDVLLEKPPGLSVTEVTELADYMHNADRVLFTTWHSQYNAAVDAAAARLVGQDIVSMRIDWREDVRKWHPGQDWMWQENGFGVFDPGINALSIATKIMPKPLIVENARLVIAQNHQSPLAVEMGFSDGYAAVFDWREEGDECWQIAVETRHEKLLLDKGGSELWIDGKLILSEAPREYRLIYRHFATLIKSRQSHVDIAPLHLVAQAIAVGKRDTVEPFLP